MLSAVARWSIDRPRLVAWACLWVFVCGLVFLRDSKVAFLPDTAPAQAVVQTGATGLVAEQVEQLVTRPVESGLAGTNGVARIHSESTEGLSTITLTFAEGANPYRVRQALLEKLTGLGGALPAGVDPPRLSPLAASGGDVLEVGFTSDKLDLMGLRDLIEWTVRPRLLAAPGVARVAVYGGQTRQIEVRARPGDLSDSDLGFLDILAAVRRSTGVAGAGFIDTPTQRVVIEPRGQALTTDAVGAGQIQTPGADPVRVNDVADVFEAPAPSFGDALIDGKPGVLLRIAGQYGVNRMDVTQTVEHALDVVRPALASVSVTVDSALDRPATFVDRTLRGVAFDLLVGAVCVALLLFVMLRSARAALISFLSIPISLLLALAALKAFGWTLNAMTLAGLAVALGVVIDDAVIDVENILAKIGEAEQAHLPRAEAILAAGVEVRAPVIYATLTMIVAVLPLLFLRGEQGALLAPMAGAIIAACIASLCVAIIVTPALAYLLLRDASRQGDRFPARAGSAYQRALTRVFATPRAISAVALLAVACALVALMTARPILFPTIHDNQLDIALTAPPSTSLAVMRDMGVRITRDLKQLTGVTGVVERIGRDRTGDDSAGLESATFDVGLAPGLDASAQAALAVRIRQALNLHPGLSPIVTTRFDAERDGKQTSAPFSVAIYGSDLDALDTAAAKIADALKRLPNGQSAHVDQIAHAPVVRVDINFQHLAIYGLSAADVLDTIQAAFAGERVAQVYQGDRAINLAVTAQDSLRRDPEAVGDLLLRSPSGFSVPLKRVSNIYLTDGRASIVHDNGLRRQIVVADPPARGAAKFAADARKTIAKDVVLPPGLFVEIADPDRGGAEAARNLALTYALLAFAIFALLAIAFDGRSAALILASTLFSLIGAAIAVLAMGGAPSVGAIAGLIALFGLSQRGAILLITRLEDLVVVGHAPWTLETVVQASRERLNPMLTTAGLVVLALAPFALRAGAAGHEIVGPMAIVIIAGLITSTLASAFLLPILIFGLWRPGLARLGRMHR